MASETVQYLSVSVTVRTLVTAADGSQLVKEHNYAKTLTDGTGTNQAGAVWNDDSRSLAATTETLDLDGLTDFKGATMSDNNAVKLIYIENLNTTTGEKLVIGGGDWAGTNRLLVGATDLLNIGPGGLLLVVSPIDGYAITAATGDGLLQNAGAATVVTKQLYGFDNV